MTVAQQAKRLEQVKDARSKWLPTASALALVDELKSLIGETVDIQFWNPIMYWLEDEGPYPLRGVMLDVAILDEGGFPQAYVVLDSPCEIPTPNGFPSIRLLQCRENIPSPLAPVAEIYEVRQV